MKLCTVLKQRFSQKISFVICPTLPDMKDAWKAHELQPQKILGSQFGGNNVSVWDGFNRDVELTSQICSLISKKDKCNVERRPAEQKIFSKLQ